jgi:hypothetical protein
MPDLSKSFDAARQNSIVAKSRIKEEDTTYLFIATPRAAA